MGFNENWYPDEQIPLLIQACSVAREQQGSILEIGCWEGRSTVALANACYPETLIAVDSWEGNTSEGADHPTIEALAERDVFATFLQNIESQTQGNVEARRQDCFEFLEGFTEPVKFCHIDAAHDYGSVKRTIELLVPRLVPGAVLCGDDYASAHAGRADLDGGVQRAVDELLPSRGATGNFWYWLNEADT